MPNRILRDGILTSEAVAELSWAEEIFYRRLMSVADDHGRYYATPKLLRAACYPLLIDKVSDADIVKWITVCVEAGLVSVYPAEDGKRYLQISKFNQQVRSKSKFPEPIERNGDEKTADENTCYQLISNDHLDVDVVEGVIKHTSKPSVPPCPVEQIIEKYKSTAIKLPSVRIVDEATKGNIRARWRQDARFQTLEFWINFFGYCESNTFLSGQSEPRDNKPPFRASLGWIVKPTNFAKIINGEYDR